MKRKILTGLAILLFAAALWLLAASGGIPEASARAMVRASLSFAAIIISLT